MAFNSLFMNAGLKSNPDKTVEASNVGDVWEVRVLDDGKQAIINAVATRGLSGKAPGVLRFSPRGAFGEGYLRHVAEFLRTTVDTLRAELLDLDLPVGDTQGVDFAAAIEIHPDVDNILGRIRGKVLDVYVDGDQAAKLAERLGMVYDRDSRCHDLLMHMRDKAQFHRYCEKAGAETIPGTVISGRLSDEPERLDSHEARCDDIVESIVHIFDETNCDAVMVRKTMAGGGIGNAKICKKGGKFFAKGKEFSQPELVEWVRDEFNEEANDRGVIIAPYHDGISISGLIRIKDGEVELPYIAREILDEEGTGFQGVEVNPNALDPRIVNQGVALLTKVGQQLMKDGLTNGLVQMDMRYSEQKEKVYPAESNAMRKTGVIEMVSIVTRRLLGGAVDWIAEAAKKLKEDNVDAFIGVDHFAVGEEFTTAAETHGFDKAFNAYRFVGREELRQVCENEAEVEAILDGAPCIDLGLAMHSTIPLHRLDGVPHMGLIVSEKTIRDGGKQNSLDQLDLQQRYRLAQIVFNRTNVQMPADVLETAV